MIFDRFINKFIEKHESELTEKWLLKQKIGDLFDFLSMKLSEEKKPIKFTIMYFDVKYTITCEPVEDFHEELKKYEGDS